MAVKIAKTLGPRVLIKKDLPPKRVGLIELPDETVNKERMALEKGVVLEMGPQAFKEAEMRDVQVTEGTTVITERSGRPWVSVGDYVMFQRYNGYRIPDPTTQSGYNEELVFVLDTDIICILEKDKEDEA